MTTALGARPDAAARLARPARRWRTGAGLACFGLLLMQVAWMLSVSPFRGSDEFDHVYKAAAVARGQVLVDPTDATRGTGAWLDVPADIVSAARPQCQALKYTTDADCVGTRLSDDTVRIASGAGRYHPLYYAIVGTAALPFHGQAALYAMRAATVLLCLALFAASLVALRSWARTAWPYVAAVVATVPVMAYSGSIVAPNGVEMMAGLLLWCSLVGLLRAPPERLGVLLTTATIGACLLVTLRSLGPIWCVLALVGVLAFQWPSGARVRDLARRRLTWAYVAVFVLFSLQSLAWVSSMGSLNVGAAESTWTASERLTAILQSLVLWPLQMIAAIPLRNEASQPAVYAFAAVLLLTLLTFAMRHGATRERFTIIACVLATFAIPAAIVWNTLDAYGDVWQGRYGLPFAVGIPLLAAATLDRVRRAMPLLVVVIGCLLFAGAHLLALVTVVAREMRVDVLVHSGDWSPLPQWALGAMVAWGALAFWYGAWAAGTAERLDRHGRADDDRTRDREMDRT